MSFATVLGRVGLVLTALFALGGLAFALGYAFDDPGGWAAVLLVAAVVLPVAALTVLALRDAPLAAKVLTVAVVLFVVWGVVSRFVDIEMPTIPVVAMMLALPIAVVGQRDATRAGELLLIVAAVPLLLVIARLVRESGPEGPGLGALLGGSTGAVVVPLAGLAVLFLVAGAMGRPARASGGQPSRPSAPAAHG